MNFACLLESVRKEKPLVQCITNFVTVNDCANIILAAGGSPFMADHPLEAAETASGMQAIVCNMGTMDKMEAMYLAGRAANKLKKPVVLDPVAAGASAFRRRELAKLLAEVKFAVIRGNASEIKAIASQVLQRKFKNDHGKGVDVSELDIVTEKNVTQMGNLAADLAREISSVIVVSGAIDLVTDGQRIGVLHGGVPMMARITGSGCMLTALLGVYLGTMPDKPYEAAAAAAALMNAAGEKAESLRLAKGTGNATFRNDLIDAVFTITGQELQEAVSYEEI